MVRLARWCFRHRKVVVALWVVALLGIGAASQGVGITYANNFSFPSTDSSRALDVLKANLPAQAGDSEQVVIQARSGTLRDPSTQGKVTAMLDQVSHLPHVATVASPYQRGEISPDGTIGLATVGLDAQAQNVPKAAVQTLIRTAQSVNGQVLNVQLGGNAIQSSAKSSQGFSELLGIVFALLILYLVAFRRSFLSSLLPLLCALLAIGIGMALIGLLTHVFAVPQFAPIVATLVGLGVGVDYALFIVSRHRAALQAGEDPESAALRALNTSGRAVFFAGITVCIALLGLFALQVSFLYGVALSAALVVALTMLASITLLPAMLGFYGIKALRGGERRELLEQGPHAAELRGFWPRWARLVGARSPILAVAALAVIVVLALPFFGMHLGLSDAGNDAPSTTTRQAYDLLAKGFGPGFNGPLQLVGELQGPQDAARFDQFATSLKGRPGIGAVGTPFTSPNGKAAVALVYPTTAPEATATSSLLHRVRAEIPGVEAGSGLTIHVGGATALQDDFSHILASKIPQFVAVVVILAFLLLAAVFRSLVIPLTASIMNLLSIGAALGAMTAVFQWGWLSSLIGIQKGPIDVFVPVMQFAILFGLSMDYEVFLVSRMHEEWTLSHDNELAVSRGQAATGRVITAAALIMILVFLSFILGGQRVIKEVGLGFAAAIFVDAFVIRTVLVPSLMHLLGRSNWWLPSWLDRLLPNISVEPTPGTAPSPAPAPAGVTS